IALTCRRDADDGTGVLGHKGGEPRVWAEAVAQPVLRGRTQHELGVLENGQLPLQPQQRRHVGGGCGAHAIGRFRPGRSPSTGSSKQLTEMINRSLRRRNAQLFCRCAASHSSSWLGNLWLMNSWNFAANE